MNYKLVYFMSSPDDLAMVPDRGALMEKHNGKVSRFTLL